MKTREINPLLKFALELGPVAIYFVLYTRIKDMDFVFWGESYSGFIVTTALFIPLILVSTAVLWILTGKLSRMQVMVAILVLGFGALSIWFNDERFFKMKPTVVYFLLSGILAVGLLRGKSYVAYVMGEALSMRHEGWMILTWRLTVFMVCMGVANEVVWRTMSTDAWVNFKTFALPALPLVFMLAQAGLIKRHYIESGPEDS